ncbi:DUF3052 domain-containing protein [Bacillus haynesii]|uniref:DUF3052 domain-containing protein n=1 Tax=Bacillus haynesii TaxID=1925021 RepID=UPI001C22E334|nr:DUF3052 domain-containing protein [Bacillus haynesii]MBU8684101.1 DUF3052 domain-containing protein [Bacillus haynesii]MCY8268721.1 DUF3052 domain-containing protein [Bacillus haynesii]MCY8354925.1 DUF3052 domain-containing protein [Bacillus haynesii]MCY8435558.1 DUF3052 domain-containing protein [Bacillus haynesii]MCY8553919.1 DUF3052 domain-containing protein [Bacillus haynesii]
MAETNPVIKKLQFKDNGQPVLIVNPPEAYTGIMAEFQGHVHHQAEADQYDFVQVFAATNAKLQDLAKEAERHLAEDGLFWLCYPKKSSKVYKGSDCSRETVAGLLADQGYEPVRQIAIDEDWSALRFRKAENIRTMKRKFAVTEKGKQRTDQE